MAIKQRETVTFRDATIIFKNFAGEARKFNAEGVRNFSILLAEADAMDMQVKGWNVKPLKRREEDEEQLYHLKVAVNFGGRPPRCWLVSNIDPQTGIGRNRSLLSEEMVSILDQLESSRVDLVISAYDWRLDSGQSGRKAYLDTIFFTMYENELEQEYSSLQQLPAVGKEALAIESGIAVSTEFDFEGDVVD